MKCEFCGRVSKDPKAEVCKGCGANIPATPIAAKFDKEPDKVAIDYGGTGMVNVTATTHTVSFGGGFSPAVNEAENTYRLNNIKGAFSRLMRPK